MFQVIARDISNIYRITISAEKCENKWKVLERNYKKVIDNNNKTGRGRKVFEFEEEFDEIFGRKKNVRPSLVLSSDTVIDVVDSSNTEINGSTVGVEIAIEENSKGNVSQITNTQDGIENVPPVATTTPRNNQTVKRKRSVRATTNTYKKRNEILLEMKNDLKNYYENKLAIERERLELSRIRCEESQIRTQFLQQFVANDLVNETE